MQHKTVSLIPLEAADREQFILDNQRAFWYGTMQEFGMRDDHLDSQGEIISRKTIEACLDAPDSEAYRIICDRQKVGGVILKIDRATHHNELDILFTAPEVHSRGIGYGAWQAVEALHPETKVWETFTPYFEKRNIHFYLNKCGFKIVEFFTAQHQLDLPSQNGEEQDGPDEMFRFVKVME